MNDTEKPPRQFANQVLKQVIQHLLTDDMVVEANDYASIRVTFRKLGGSWFDLSQGDITQIDLLKKVVTAWGALPNRKKVQDQVI
jgi:hypothetical protein